MKTRRNRMKRPKQTRKHKRRLSRQKGGGLVFNLIPSNVKLIGYFFIDGLKSTFNNLMGKRTL